MGQAGAGCLGMDTGSVFKKFTDWWGRESIKNVIMLSHNDNTCRGY